MARSNTGASNVVGILTDDGGRPVTDRGGRLVLTTGKLDPLGTEPIEPTVATGTEDEPPAEPEPEA